MFDDLKRAEEEKRNAMWQPGERRRQIQAAINWAEAQQGVNRNSQACRLAEQKKKLRRLSKYTGRE